MRISEIAEALELDTVTAVAEDREVTGVYACDFLSRVMSCCGAGNIWITVRTHLNVLAVATMQPVSSYRKGSVRGRQQWKELWKRELRSFPVNCQRMNFAGDSIRSWRHKELPSSDQHMKFNDSSPGRGKLWLV